TEVDASMELGLLQLSASAYLVAAGLFGLDAMRDSDRPAVAGAVALAAGFLLHTISIVSHSMRLGLLPVATFSEGVSFFAWLVAGLFILVSGGVRLNVIGAIVSPLACFLTVVAVASYTESEAIPLALHSPWLPVHVTLAFLGNAVFALAFAISVIYLAQERQLKSRRNPWIINRLPSLEELDRLNYRCLVWGLPLLTLGMLSGGIWAAEASGHFWSGEAREILSLMTWFVYGGLLQSRVTAGLRGRRAAVLTILGFAFVVVSYFSIPLLDLPGRHGGGLGI
ncbi:MAG: cytochrome c biogenesis protein CcsA, partial [Candidatus Binatia bacterium]